MIIALDTVTGKVTNHKDTDNAVVLNTKHYAIQVKENDQ